MSCLCGHQSFSPEGPRSWADKQQAWTAVSGLLGQVRIGQEPEQTRQGGGREAPWGDVGFPVGPLRPQSFYSVPRTIMSHS